MGMKNQKFIFIITLIFLILISNHCQFFKSKGVHEIKQGELFRFIAHLKKENIVKTPLKNVIEKFELKEEDLTGKWIYLSKASNKEYDIFGCTTKFPILGISEEIKPEKMKLFQNGKEIKFFSETEKQMAKWKWLPVERIINIKEMKGYSRILNAIILKSGDSLSFETIFPEGEIYIEMSAKNANPSLYTSEIELSLNDQSAGKVLIDYDDYYKITVKNVKFGRYFVKLKYNYSLKKSRKNKSKKINKGRLFIYNIRIKSSQDILLLMIPKEKKSKNVINSSRIKAIYYIKHDNIKKYFDFYKIQKQFPIYDLGIKENPYLIKKKINIYDRDLNCLFAPPKSEYNFKIKISSNAFLEFGYGILSNSNISNIEFKILINDSKKQHLLFFDRIECRERNDKLILKEKINLSKFKNKKIEISFITEGNGLSFWYNPIIYSPGKNNINIILISLDTLRASNLGCYGYKRNTSPHIDTLAKDSVLFENTFAPTSWTLPSHLSIFTSLDTIHHGVYYNNQKLPSSIPTLADILRTKGYLTGAFTGGGYVSHIFGFSKGFDFYQEQKGGRFAFLRDNEARLLYEICSKWIEENKEKKFFLFLHTFQTHSPYSSPPPWGQMFLNENAKWGRIAIKNFLNIHGENYKFSKEEIENIISLYDGEIRYTDEALIRPLIKLLKDLNIYDKTIIILTSDHGEEFYDHGGWEHGRTLYNELIKVPLIIKFPYSKYKGIRISSIVRLIDILPTILEEIGINYSKYKFDGKSLIDLITNKNSSDRVFYSDLAHKDIKNPCPALISTNFNNYKLIIDYMHNKIELYDMKKDPTEKVDLSLLKKSLVSELLSRIEDYYKTGSRIKKEEIIIDKELRERLKALGYIK